jgi:hypothetical protein
MLPDHQKLFFKKDIFERLESGNFFSKNNTFYCMKWLKTCFEAFAHTSRTPESFFQKRFFLTVRSGVKNVF